ncbi:MAG: ABC transporter substrate-binding protein [Chloroflexi bacterium]|nr:ABC transporter substrate-binding protein [Chloroflexota bacterium]
MKRTVSMGLLVLILSLVLAAAACSESTATDSTQVVQATATTGSTPTSEGSKFGGTLRIVSQASIPTLDPMIGGAYVTTAVGSHIYETLFGWDENTEDQPVMVDTWNVSSDSMTWNFTLREGMKFHDGTPVTAGDVKSTYTRWINGWYSIAGLMGEFMDEDSFVVNSDTSFTINLKKRTGAVILSLAKPYGSPRIMPSRIDEGVTSAIAVEEWVGSGPYKFVRWEQGDRIVLNRNEGFTTRDEPSSLYTGKVTAYIDELIWLEIPDEETKIAGLETGEWDVVDGAGLDFFQRLNSNADLTVPLYKPGHRSNVFLIPGQAPFDNTNARLAVQTGLDMEAIMTSLGPSDLWTLCGAVFYCGTRWETSAGVDEYYNVNDKVRAKELLDASGYAGETIILLNPTDYSTITPTGFVVRQELEQIGFNVEMPALDWATIVTKFGNPESFNVATSWDVHWNSTSPLEHEAIGASIPLFPKIDKLHELRSQFAQATTDDEKFRLLDEIQLEFFKAVPAVYEGVFYSIYPATAALKNFEVKAFPYYANAWLER